MLLIISLIYSSQLCAAQELMAYLAYTDDYWQLWVMTPDGNNKKQITSTSYDKSHISWFPDGNEILVNGNQGKLTRVNIRTHDEQQITLPIKGTVDAVVSPNGQYIVFSLSVADSIDNNHIWRVNVNGGELTQMTNMAGLQHEPVWSPDGQWIYFLSGEGNQSHDIWRVSIGKKNVEQLTVAQLYNFDVTFSRTGDMAFSSNRAGNYDVWLKTNNKVRRLTKNDAIDSRPTFSPDGQNISFESLRSGSLNIWQKSLMTNEIKQLTNESIGARFPVWSY